MRNLFASVAIAALYAVPVQAGEEVLQAPAPGWVEAVDFDSALAQGEEIVLLDRQIRFEGGVVTRYADVAYDVTSQQAVSNYSTLQFGWMPDKGDLTIHRLEIIREGEAIDLIAQGVEPEVIRRERQLEQRMVDGLLTAVVRVPGLLVGDVLRFATSTTLRDQALGGHVQTTEYATAQPARLGFGRLRLSWPQQDELRWQALGQVELDAPETRDGYTVIDLPLPIPKPVEMPEDAPDRFRLPPAVQITSFESWSDVVATMAPHYTTRDRIEPDGALAAEIARIEAATDVPIERAALALRSVQDEVTYLLDGMNGGNYLPQAPELTWKVKYGDCKAKSLLLLTMLREMGIAADAMLVHSERGDALAVFQPQPGAFDHMVVRALIDGTDYWLDGTSAGIRLDSMYEIPDFAYALPLADDAEGLIEIEQRWPAVPDRTMRVTYDLSRGVDIPALLDIEVKTRGILAARMRAPASERVPERILGHAMEYLDDLVDAFIYDAEYSYDEETGTGILKASGMVFEPTEFDRGIASLAMHSATTNWDFSPDRARAAWRDIPYQVGGPYTAAAEVTYLLPEDKAKVTVAGIRALDQTTAGTRFRRSIEDGDKRVQVSDYVSYIPSEILPADIPAEKTAMRRLASGDPVMRIAEAGRSWELADKDLAERMQPHIAALTEMSEEFSDVPGLIYLRGLLKLIKRDHDGALADIDLAIAEEATVERLTSRIEVLHELGRVEEARKTAQEAFDLTGDLTTASWLARTLVATGEAEQALALLDSLGLAGEEARDVAILWGEYAGDAGRVDEARARLEDALADRPGWRTAQFAVLVRGGMGLRPGGRAGHLRSRRERKRLRGLRARQPGAALPPPWNAGQGAGRPRCRVAQGPGPGGEPLSARRHPAAAGRRGGAAGYSPRRTHPAFGGSPVFALRHRPEELIAPPSEQAD